MKRKVETPSFKIVPTKVGSGPVFTDDRYEVTSGEVYAVTAFVGWDRNFGPQYDYMGTFAERANADEYVRLATTKSRQAAESFRESGSGI